MAVAYFLLLSSLGLAITTQAQDCDPPDGGENMSLKGDDILAVTFPDGTRVAFTCDVGYVSAGGSGSITCTTGTWSEVRLKCERRNCGSFQEVENGVLDYSQGILYGDILVISCKEGYSLVGKSQILCGALGWEGRPPECEVPIAQNCSQPVGGDNMSLKGDDIPLQAFPDGTNVTFECDPGYVSAGGSGTIACTAGSWSPVMLKCEVVTCVGPSAVANGIFSPSKESYNYGEVVQYSCVGDYTLVGSRSLTCSDDGTFKPDPPTCTRVECPDLDIRNADWFEGSRPPHGYKSTVTYRCRSGYTIRGAGTLTCEQNSQWSPGIPGCIKTTTPTRATTTA